MTDRNEDADRSDGIADGEYTAVLDRIEDELAALEVATDDGPRELVVDLDELPAEGREPDAVFVVEVEGDRLAGADYEPEETARRTEDAQRRFDRLSRRPPGRDSGEE